MSITNLIKRKTTTPATVKTAEVCFISEDGSAVSLVSGNKAKRICKTHGVEAVRRVAVRTK